MAVVPFQSSGRNRLAQELFGLLENRLLVTVETLLGFSNMTNTAVAASQSPIQCAPRHVEQLRDVGKAFPLLSQLDGMGDLWRGQ